MTIEFDPVNKYILLPNVTTITAQEIYNEAMDWHDENIAMGYSVPMKSTGFAPLGGGAYTDKIFILQDGWKIKPYSGTYILNIVGTIITDDESNRIVPPDSGSVQIIFQVTSQGIVSVVETGGTSLTQEEHNKLMTGLDESIPNNVWDEDITAHTNPNTFGEYVTKIKRWVSWLRSLI